jgi:hypothetical protein
METKSDVILYVVELAYGDQPFVITSPDNRRHLQLRTDTAPLWHKENMINLGVRNLLPSGWKEFAWIDCDVDFRSTSWVRDTIRLLNGPFDVVQLFSNVIDMDREEKPVGIFTGFGKASHSGKQKGTPGFAWACNHAAYTSMGGLPQFGIIGGGDNILALSLINQVLSSTQNFNISNDLKNHMHSRERCMDFGLAMFLEQFVTISTGLGRTANTKTERKYSSSTRSPLPPC